MLQDKGTKVWVMACRWLAAACGLLVGMPALAVSLIQNGSFETPALASGSYVSSPANANWTFTGSAYIQSNGSVWGAASTQNGTQTAVLQSLGAIAQNFNAATAGTYLISFRASQRGCCVTPYSQAIDVSIDGTVIGQAAPTTTTAYTGYQYSIQLNAGTHTLRLAGTVSTANTAFIDAVVVESKPLIQNGSFEMPVLASGGVLNGGGTGWTYGGGTGGAGILSNGSPYGSPNAPDGTQAMYMQGTIAATQSLTLADAGSYVLSFQAAQRQCCTSPYAQKINVIVDGTTIGQAAPQWGYYTAYSYPLTLTAGTHTLKLAGTATVDNTAFVDMVVLQGVTAVTMTAPAANGTVSASGASLTAAAGEPSGGVAKVDFYNGTTLLGTATQAPFSYTWSGMAAGTYSVTAKATDIYGNIVTSLPVSFKVYAAPTVSVSGPSVTLYAAPASIGLSATATASGTGNTISQVAFFNGDTFLGNTSQAPYNFIWGNVPAGTYNVKAVATDSLGGTTTSQASTLTVVNDAAPTVSLYASPTTATAPAAITLTATAADSDGTVARVEFYKGDVLIGIKSQAPFTYTWSNVGVGSYSVTAKAIDNLGTATVSAPVSVTVTGVLATVYYVDNDQVNTPRLITDQNNVPVWKWGNDDPFGYNLPNQDPGNTGQAFEFNQRFPGQYYDKETGLFYNYFRDYDPSTGRYIESDPLGLAAGPNTYAYVNGNPLTRIDPLGLADVKFGGGYTGRIDTVPGTDTWEIHVYGPNGNEVGMYNGSGWFNKHGHKGAPENIPSDVENQIRGAAINEMRRRGLAPPKGKANIKGMPICEIPGLKVLGALGWLGTYMDWSDLAARYNKQNKHDEENAKECGAKPGSECL